MAKRPGGGVTRWERFFRRLIYNIAGVGGSCLRYAQDFGSFAQIRRLDPQHPAAAAGARAECLNRRGVDLSLGQFTRDFCDRSGPVFTLDQEATLLLA